MENETHSFKWVQKLCYGMGHVYNDLCAAMWFSYTLFYLQIVLEMEAKTAGALIMTGQIVDSVATPIAGWAVDRTSSRRAWHFTGTLAVLFGFSLIYCFKTSLLNTWWVAYYGIVITLFQIGWAVTQISHLSIIPEMAANCAHTAELTAIRYTASVCCNITVYIITFFILKKNDDPSKIGPADFYKFKEISLIITMTGLFSSFIFYCGAFSRQKNVQKSYEIIPEFEADKSSDLVANGNVTHFLKSTIIYKVSLMYMSSRLFTTLTLIYIPLYIYEREASGDETGDKIRQTIASVPLVCFITSFLLAIGLKWRSRLCSDKLVYFGGIMGALLASVWIRFGISSSTGLQLYLIAALIGVSGSVTMITSLCLTAEFVKVNGFGGASVYSTVTFTDKLVSGGIVLLVQYLQCEPSYGCPHFYRDVLTYVCGTVSLIGLVSLLSLHFK